MQVPAAVEYEKATSLGHALSLLARYGPEARILAGGHSLIPMMKLRLAQPEVLVDVNGLDELRYIRAERQEPPSPRRPAPRSMPGAKATISGMLCIGALTTHAELLDSALAAGHFAILTDAERVIADPIVRQWGTVGGSLCQADPSEDLSAAFAAVKGTMVIAGPDGSRTVPAREFHTGPFQTVVGPGEMLTEIRLPVMAGAGTAYVKVSRRAGDWAIGAAGAALWLDSSGVITDAGIGLAALGARHFVAAEAEEYLLGQRATPEAFERAGSIAAANCRPAADQRGPEDYKRHLAGELTRRALTSAWHRSAPGATPQPPRTAAGTP